MIPFDKIYLLNLLERKDRLALAEAELDANGIRVDQVMRSVKNNNGALGLRDTYKNIISDCMEHSLQNILVFEDDVKFLYFPVPVIGRCMQQVPKSWDMVYFGCNLFQGKSVKLVSPNLIRLDWALALHAVAISKTGINKIATVIENAEYGGTKTDTPLDLLIADHIMPCMNCYCSYPMIATQRNGYSDIEKAEVNYSGFLEKRFKEKTKHLK